MAFDFSRISHSALQNPVSGGVFLLIRNDFLREEMDLSSDILTSLYIRLERLIRETFCQYHELFSCTHLQLYCNWFAFAKRKLFIITTSALAGKFTALKCSKERCFCFKLFVFCFDLMVVCFKNWMVPSTSSTYRNKYYIEL